MESGSYRTGSRCAAVRSASMKPHSPTYVPGMSPHSTRADQVTRSPSDHPAHRNCSSDTRRTTREKRSNMGLEWEREGWDG